MRGFDWYGVQGIPCFAGAILSADGKDMDEMRRLYTLCSNNEENPDYFQVKMTSSTDASFIEEFHQAKYLYYANYELMAHDIFVTVLNEILERIYPEEELSLSFEDISYHFERADFKVLRKYDSILRHLVYLYSQLPEEKKDPRLTYGHLSILSYEEFMKYIRGQYLFTHGFLKPTINDPDLLTEGEQESLASDIYKNCTRGEIADACFALLEEKTVSIKSINTIY